MASKEQLRKAKLIRAHIQVDLSGAENVKKSLVNKVIRQSVRKNAKIVLGVLKSNVSSNKRTGALYKSLTVKVKTYKRTTVVAIVGPRTNYSIQIGKYLYKPSKVFHLLEKGSKYYSGKHPLKRAQTTTQRRFADSVARDVRQGIEELAKKR